MVLASPLPADEIHDAAQSGDLAKVRSLLTQDPALVNAAGRMGSPLHYALFGGHVNVVRHLLAGGADVNAVHEATGFTPLHASVYSDNPVLTQELISQGAEINSRGRRGYAPLDLAIVFGKTEVAGLFIEYGADIEAENGQGRRPLTHASWLGREEVVNQLLDAGADANGRDSKGQTPILAATIKGREAIVDLLLGKGAGVEAADGNRNMLLLHHACVVGHPNIVESIIAAGAKVDAVDSTGRTALHYAARHGHHRVADLLLENGAKRPSDLVENYGRSSHLSRTLSTGEAVAWYLNHRGWAVKTREHLLVFDAEEFGVARPAEPCLANGFLTPEEVSGENLVALYTCYHGDPGELAYVHGLTDKAASATYLHLQEDRFRGGDNCVYLKPGEGHELNGVTVTTINGFTGDPTLAYVCEIDGVSVFYAGFNPADPAQFKQDIDDLAKQLDQVDLAFLPIPEPDAEGDVFYHMMTKLKPKAVCLLDPDRREDLFLSVASEVADRGFSCEVFCAENPGDHYVYQRD
jgi:ankyrin repeat protein